MSPSCHTQSKTEIYILILSGESNQIAANNYWKTMIFVYLIVSLYTTGSTFTQSSRISTIYITSSTVKAYIMADYPQKIKRLLH